MGSVTVCKMSKCAPALLHEWQIITYQPCPHRTNWTSETAPRTRWKCWNRWPPAGSVASPSSLLQTWARSGRSCMSLCPAPPVGVMDGWSLMMCCLMMLMMTTMMRMMLKKRRVHGCRRGHYGRGSGWSRRPSLVGIPSSTPLSVVQSWACLWKRKKRKKEEKYKWVIGLVTVLCYRLRFESVNYFFSLREL